MRRSRTNSSDDTRSVIERLARPPRIEDVSPIAARFVFSLRLIALHDRARRDPVPELAARLGSVDVAAKALALGQAVSAIWPENVHVSRFCCSLLSHDELTVATLIDSASCRDRPGFEAAIEGLIRPDRIQRLWEPVLALVAAEVRAA
ncbi:MAG: DNA-directed RNA polymerase subunit beta' [Erythrobacter sp.]